MMGLKEDFFENQENVDAEVDKLEQ